MSAFRPSLARMAATFRAPSKIVCVGRNYAAHVKELNNVRPKQPFYFLKPPSSIVLPGAGPVVRPKGVDAHFEVELGVVIGKQLRDFDASDEKGALDAIESYVLAIDMTGRNVQNEAKNKGLPWDIAKGYDTFLPLGAVIPKSAIRDPHDVELFLKVNGETKQDASTSLMLFRVPRLLSDISKVMTLEPGDIVLTGTPAGVGPVVPGDVMRAGVRVGGVELEDAKIEVPVEDSTSSYEFSET
ncbi:probable fumarylacetoacetate hydrolase domain-containing protein 1 [Cephalotrichum gorgonifer]|uniref:Probable fumarylacetoacetate hydrolase domain-containing protein 1 n=1 Tax=Cephalotrichum gorgonifer TaxID=2041049 RepID=A0AAE8SU63_9PEZI|nr:probable fumarylacetoacetate hydrolase domain-containing protein 1 [Cephalotrichum gorgonifer]